MDRPRIIMLIERFWPLIGGSERQCFLLSQSLIQAGWTVSVVTRRVQTDTPLQESMSQIPVYRLPPSGIGQRWPELIFSFHTAAYLWRVRQDYEIVHLHSATSILGLIIIPWLRLLHKKVIVKVATAGDISKDVIESTAGDTRPTVIHRLINRAINIALKRAHKIICISQEIYDELRKNGAAEKILVKIPNAVDTKKFAPISTDEKASLRRQLDLPAASQIVMFSGRLIRRKGIDILLQAWPAVHQSHPRAHLLIIGGSAQSLDSAEAELVFRAQAEPAKTSIHFLGEQSNILPYLQAADIFAFPSRREGLSNALLEAMSCGLSVVASDIGGNIDIIQPEKNGLLFPKDNVNLLAKMLKRLLNDPQLRQALSITARQDMIAKFSMDILRPQVEQIYRQYG